MAARRSAVRSKARSIAPSPASEARPRDMAPPSLFLLAMEGRAWMEWASWLVARPWFSQAGRGDGHPVLVLPGLLASDRSTWPLRKFLEHLGYTAYPWELGFNHGPKPGMLEHLQQRIAEIRQLHGKKPSLIGWSLGGLMARALAWQMPEHVRSVLTLGSPPAAEANATNARKVFELVSGLDPHHADVRKLIGGHPDVPLTSILSRYDGVVHWRSSLVKNHPRAENVEVPASHLGMGVNPLVLWVIADRLAQHPDRWSPFSHHGWRKLVYRNPGHAEHA